MTQLHPHRTLHRMATHAGIVSLALLTAVAGRAQVPDEPPSPPPLAIDALQMNIVETPEGEVVVHDVETAGPAAVLDLRPGDVIRVVGEDPVRTYNDLVSALDTAVEAQEIVVGLTRDGEPLEVRVRAPAEAGQPFEPLVERERVGMFGMTIERDESGRSVVREVSPETPAEAAGARVNDIIVNFGGHRVRSVDGLMEFANKLAARLDPGAEIEVLVARGDEQRKLVIVMPETSGAVGATDDVPTAAAEAEIVFCMAVREAAGGRVIVVEVREQSPPALAGILPGDTIVSVAEQEIRSIADLVDVISRQQEGDRVAFAVLRGEEIQGTEVVMAPCETTDVADAATLDALEAQLRLLEAQVEELRQTVDVLRGTLHALRNGGVQRR